MRPFRSAEAIFKDDPLLLHPESQIDYGREILWNLLMKRTISSYIPIDPKSGKKRQRPSEQPVPGGIDDLRDDYIKTRKSRGKLEAPVAKELRKLTMVADGTKTNERLNGTFPRRHEAEPQFKEQAKSGRRILRIAAVGFRVKIGLRPEKAYLGEDLLPAVVNAKIDGMPDGDELLQLGRTRRNPDRKDDSWERTVVDHIETAIKNDSQIVVLGEFAMPPIGKDGDASKKAIIACCETHGGENHFVFAGSRHQGAYNIGFMHMLEARQPKRKWQYKVASARGLRENILGPQSGELESYLTTIKIGKDNVKLNVIVAICYDAFDPSMFLNLIMQSVTAEQEHKEQRIVLVPSFNPSSEFVEMLRDLSFVAKCPVVYVNSLHGDARMFISGFSVRSVRGANSNVVITYLEDELSRRNNERQASGSDNEKKAPPITAHEERKELRGEDRYIRQLLRDMRNLKDRNALDNLITVEDCAECRTGHKDDYHCKNDIVYYNIDFDLLDALNDFRNQYFRNDTFLPEPFSEDGRREMLKQVRQKEQDREARDRDG